MIKGIIFDFDGVIVETESKKFSDLKQILLEYDYVLSPESFYDMIGKKTKTFLLEKFPGLPSTLLDNILKQRKKRLYAESGTIKLVPGIKGLLRYLKKRDLKLAITTGSEKEFVDSLLRVNGLRDYFDMIITGEQFNSSKPDPECYAITLKKMALNPDDVIVIEDSLAGILAAKKMGCVVIGIETYGKITSALSDYIFKNHSDILKFFRSNKELICG
jgi:beta-phosphoglucomutase